jgi:hypothetical protein
VNLSINESSSTFIVQTVELFESSGIMLIGFLRLSLASSLPSGFTPINISDPRVTAVHEFLFLKIALLFPDVRDWPIIESAALQIVSGYNLRVQVSALPDTTCTMVVYVNPEKEFRIVSISPPDIASLRSSYKWEDSETVNSDAIDAVISMAREDGFRGKVAKILAVRTRSASGLFTHVIFADRKGAVHSAVAYGNRKQKTLLTFYHAVK